MEREHPSTGPLAGLRVLDLTTGMPGAVATMFLADYGAEVVKVARPGAPSAQDRACRTWDRGKAGIVLDLHDPADRDVARSLAAGADVVVAGLRPGFLESVGLGAEAIRAANPDVVHCTISAFGSATSGDDPPGYAALAAARYGVMAESGGHRDGPIFPGHPALEYGTAFMAVISTLAALRARIVTGEGDLVEVTMADSVLAQMGMNWWNERNLSFIARKSRTGALDMGHMRMLLRRYTCADGRMVQIHTGAAGAFGRAMELFGLADEISRVDAAVETSTQLTDEDLQILRDRLPPLFASKPARRVAAALLGARGGLPAGATTRDGLRRRPDPPRRHHAPARRSRAGPDRGGRPRDQALEEPRRGPRAGAAPRPGRRDAFVPRAGARPVSSRPSPLDPSSTPSTASASSSSRSGSRRRTATGC